MVDFGSRLQSGTLYVVTVGINAYQGWPRLANARSDAEGVHRLLVEDLGAEEFLPPICDADATKRQLEELVEQELPGGLTESDSLVFFLAGHGHTRVDRVGDHDLKTGYVVPVDARPNADAAWASYIELDRLLKNLARLPARHILAIFDTCHSGFAFGDSVHQHRGDPPEYVESLSAKLSRRAISSAMHDQVALDSGPIPGHSLFTGMMIQGLRYGDADSDFNGFVTTSELALYLQQVVAQKTQQQQTPDFGSFLYDQRGELVFRLPDAGRPTQEGRRSARGMIYWHDEEFGETEARLLQRRLERFGMDATVSAYGTPGRPDAVYIGRNVDARCGQYVLRQMPYAVRYLFPPNLSGAMGGSDAGDVIGIGYRSAFRSGTSAHVPATAVTSRDLEWLGEAGLGDEEFQARLRRLTGSDAQSI